MDERATNAIFVFVVLPTIRVLSLQAPLASVRRISNGLSHLQLLFFFSRALTFFFFHLHETYDANSIQLIFSAVRRLRLESFAEARNRGLGRVPRLQQDPLRGEAASNTSSNTVGALSAAYVRWASELPLQRTTAFFSSENSFSPTRRI